MIDVGEAEQALHASEDRFRQLVAAINGVVWEADPRTLRFTYVSDRAEAILGFPAQRWTEESDFWLDRLHLDDRVWAPRFCEQEVRAGRDHSFEYRMIAADGRVVWLQDITTLSREGGRVTALRGVFIDVTERRRAEEEFRRLALYDPLTGLANRTQFKQLLELALPSTGGAGVILITLERFHEVIASFGHEVGEELIRQAGARIRDGVAPALAARLGAYDFGILVSGDPPNDDPRAVAEHALAAFEAPFELEAGPVGLRVVAGIAAASEDARDTSTMLRRADAALGEARRQGQRYAPYTADLEELAAAQRRRVHQSSDLLRAIRQEELVLHFQPIVDLRSGATVGAEALVRWQHTDRGLLLPDAFLPTPEESYVARALDDWVLRRAIDHAASWQRAGFDLPVAVNIGAPFIEDRDFPDRMARILYRANYPADRLGLEITESAAMTDRQRVAHNIRRLRSLGVGVAIDDFGTGHSSLAHLEQLPVSTLKLDRAFARDLVQSATRQHIVMAVVDIAHGLGMTVVAEGIEDASELAIVRQLDADRAQGLHLSAPLDLVAFVRWLRASPLALALA